MATDARVADTYKGESLQKKCARHRLWCRIADYLEESVPPDGLCGIHIVLASREGGDIGAAWDVGIPLVNVIAVDVCEDAIRACASRWTSFAREMGEPPPQFVLKDAAAAVEQCSGFPVPIRTVFLDFCSHIDRSTLDCASRCWRAMPVGANLIVGVLSGREKKQRDMRVHGSGVPRNRRERRGVKSKDARVALLADMMAGKRDWDIGMLLASDTRSNDPYQKRVHLIGDALMLADARSMPKVFDVSSYQSVTSDSRGVPMLMAAYTKTLPSESTSTSLEWIRNWFRFSQKSADAYARAIISHRDSADPRDDPYVNDPKIYGATSLCAAFNVPPRSLPAFKAHLTRGTYANM